MVPIQSRQRRVGVRRCQACSCVLLDVSLRGQVERFLQDSAGFVGCYLVLGWRTALKRQQVGEFRHARSRHNVQYARHVVSPLVDEAKRSLYAMASCTSSADDLASIDLD